MFNFVLPFFVFFLAGTLLYSEVQVYTLRWLKKVFLNTIYGLIDMQTFDCSKTLQRQSTNKWIGNINKVYKTQGSKNMDLNSATNQLCDHVHVTSFKLSSGSQFPHVEKGQWNYTQVTVCFVRMTTTSLATITDECAHPSVCWDKRKGPFLTLTLPLSE